MEAQYGPKINTKFTDGQRMPYITKKSSMKPQSGEDGGVLYDQQNTKTEFSKRLMLGMRCETEHN
jgi:hypothetical protein